MIATGIPTSPYSSQPPLMALWSNGTQGTLKLRVKKGNLAGGLGFQIQAMISWILTIDVLWAIR